MALNNLSVSGSKKRHKTFKNKNEAVTPEDLANLEESFKNFKTELNESVGTQQTWIVGGFIVLVGGFIAMLFPFSDYITNIVGDKENLKLEMTNKINQQEIEIHDLKNDIQTLKEVNYLR